MSDYRNQTSLEELEQYDRREARAYAMFEKQYQRRYPQPSKPSVVKRLPGLGWLFLLIAVAGSLLAAERTVSVFVEIARLTSDRYIAYGVGAIAFIVVDVGAISFRYARIFLTYRYADTPPAITDWVSRGAAFALGTQLAAQLYGVRGIVSWLPGGVEDALQLAIALAAALSGMLLAFITGEILAVMALQAQHENRAERVQYDADMVLWRAGLTSDWEAKRHRFVGTLSRTDKRSRSDTDKRADKRPAVARKPSPSEEKAYRFLADHPELSGRTVRELAVLSGVNRDAANKAKQRFEWELSVPLSERVSAHSNGHGKGET